MTLGMDASAVFSEMCRASFTNDEVMKKMIYFYLTTYAEDNADLAIMAVNTFKKDCKHTSSKIRGLALRNLCSFKSADYVNNVLPVIRELLNDFEPYVKKTAIMGLLKVFYVEPATILQDDALINILSALIKDSDPLVSVNAFLALDEILVSEGGIPINMKMYLYLIRRLR
jgi:AP-4 complex subunit beta-1